MVAPVEVVLPPDLAAPVVRVCVPKPPNWPVVRVPIEFARARGNEVHSHLSQGGAVDFRELDLQQNFLGADRAEGQHVHYFRRISAGQFSGALGYVFGGNVPGEHDRGARRRDRDLLIGEYAVFFFGAGADVHVDAQIEAARAFQFIPDQQRNFSRRPAMNQDLRGGDGLA